MYPPGTGVEFPQQPARYRFSWLSMIVAMLAIGYQRLRVQYI
jgi:hypothetical protein